MVRTLQDLADNLKNLSDEIFWIMAYLANIRFLATDRFILLLLERLAPDDEGNQI